MSKIDTQIDVFDPPACFRELSAAYHHLGEALAHVPMEDDRKVILTARVNIGSLMIGLLNFDMEDDRDDAGIDVADAALV